MDDERAGRSPSTSAPTLTADDVRWAAAQFARAPSVNNTQPWRLEWDGHRFLVRADRDRQLSVSDPSGRELIMSCGAALFGLRVALDQLGWSYTVRRLPNPLDPDLLAIVEVIGRSGHGAPRRVMPPGFQRRHTHRGAGTPLPATVAQAVAMQEAAAGEGAELMFVNDLGPLRAILRLTHEAELQVADDLTARRETAQWTFPRGQPQRDGVPGTAFSRSGGTGGPGQLARRDFDVGRGIGRLQVDPVVAHQVAVLVTREDEPFDWVQAGEALHALLVRAADDWVFAEINSRVTELPDARIELARQLGTLHHPHLVLQFCAAVTAPRTPRRPVEAFLTIAIRDEPGRPSGVTNRDHRP